MPSKNEVLKGRQKNECSLFSPSKKNGTGILRLAKSKMNYELILIMNKWNLSPRGTIAKIVINSTGIISINGLTFRDRGSSRTRFFYRGDRRSERRASCGWPDLDFFIEGSPLQKISPYITQSSSWRYDPRCFQNST